MTDRIDTIVCCKSETDVLRFFGKPYSIINIGTMRPKKNNSARPHLRQKYSQNDRCLIIQIRQCQRQIETRVKATPHAPRVHSYVRALPLDSPQISPGFEMTTRFPGFRQIVREFVPSVVRAIGGVLRPRRASRPVYRWARPERRAHAAPVVVGRDDHLRPSCAFLSVFLVVYAQAYMASLGQVGDHHAAVYKLNAAAYSYHAVVLTFFVSDSVWRHVQSTKYACVQCLMSSRFKHCDRNVPVASNIYLCVIGIDRRTLLRLVLQAEEVWQTKRAARDADLDVD